MIIPTLSYKVIELNVQMQVFIQILFIIFNYELLLLKSCLAHDNF